jgi:nicotinamidase-related amidase
MENNARLIRALSHGSVFDVTLENPSMKYMMIAVAVATLATFTVAADDAAPLKLTQRYRVNLKGDTYETRAKEEAWKPSQTALIVCDVWDAHHCLNAVRRLDEMLPRMNEVVAKARSQGVLIIHAPSSCMEPYKNTPGRKLAMAAPKAKNLPAEIGVWCHKIPAEEKGKYPIDQSDGGEDDDLKEHAEWHAKLKAQGRNPRSPWLKQHDGITIKEGDAISDSGVEIWNLLESRRIDNVILLGVHTNMCVLGRPFGLRQMAKNGKNVVLMRDMTDTMYNPKMSPYVSHFKGTELIVEHIEKFVCPTITSDQLIGGKTFRFKLDVN